MKLWYPELTQDGGKEMQYGIILWIDTNKRNVAQRIFRHHLGSLINLTEELRRKSPKKKVERGSRSRK